MSFHSCLTIFIIWLIRFTLHSGKKTLDDRCGSHYYVGCALAKNQLRVVTYLSPQSFDCEKDLIRERASAASA